MGKLLGVILCGGTGRRFEGADKGLLTFHGETFLARAEAALAPLVTQVLLEDKPNLGGPIGALCHALRECSRTKSDGILLIPCDMPYLSTELLSLLVEDFSEQGQAVFLRSLNDTVQPLVGIYPTDALPIVEAQILAGQYRMHALLDKLPHRVLTPSEETFPKWWVNVNSPQDYAGLLK
jgi:molybdopterin-guanine dinucleotide biosynthesis protein A